MSESTGTCAECGQPATLKCSACKLASYCGKEHQKSHWKEHRNVCKAYEIKHSEELGRYLIATRNLSPGDLIISETPVVFGPRPHPIEEGPVPCIGCSRWIHVQHSSKCPGCGWPSCDQFCPALKDPLYHGQECFLLSLRPPGAIKNFHDFFRHDTLLALRCLLLQKKSPKKWQQVMDMEAHLDKRGPTTEVYKEINERIVSYLQENFIRPLKSLEEKSKQVMLDDVSEKIIHKICAVIDVNALEINRDVELSALFPMAALMEHSCIPNTLHYFEDELQQYKIIVKAAVPIKKGEHISTMYTHALWGTQARREHLKETKYFACKCPRCVDPTELGTHLSALRCIGTDKEECGGMQLPVDPCDQTGDWTCDKCSMKVPNSHVAQLVNQLGEEVDNVQGSNPTVLQLEQILTKLLTFLHPNHYHCFSVKHSLVQLYGYQQGYLPFQLTDDMLMSKVKICLDLIDVTTKIDPGNARLSLYTGVLLHELHLANVQLIKRKWHTMEEGELKEQIKQAKQLLVTALDVLKNDLSTSAGAKLSEVIKESQRSHLNWLLEHDIKTD